VGATVVTDSLKIAIYKLAIAGEQAGFTVEQMIHLLNHGLAVETLLDLIVWRFEFNAKPLISSCSSSDWVA
jgi:hypothetical protein